jgi:TPR repeat protein
MDGELAFIVGIIILFFAYGFFVRMRARHSLEKKIKFLRKKRKSKDEIESPPDNSEELAKLGTNKTEPSTTNDEELLDQYKKAANFAKHSQTDENARVLGANIDVIRDMLKSDMEEDSEELFDKYLKHTEPLSGEVQDFDLALGYLKRAVSLGHPDATFVLGTLMYSGNAIPKDAREGMRLMQKGKDLGAAEAESIATSMGIDLDDDQFEKNTDQSFTPENSQIACQQRIDFLHAEKIITDQQKTDLYEVVRSLDHVHLANVLGMLHNQNITKELAGYAGRITGWDQENATFYVSK